MLAQYTLRGESGVFFLVLHEISHNLATGLAIIDQNQNLHRQHGGTNETYDHSSAYFRIQESMTNRVAINLAGQIGVSAFSPKPGDTAFPPYGVYSGEGF